MQVGCVDCIVGLKNLIYAVRVQGTTNKYLQSAANCHTRHRRAAFCIKG